jgi:outer membrane biogenesis lipoprotein LolB
MRREFLARRRRRAPWSVLMAAVAILALATGCAIRRPPNLPAPLASPDTAVVLARARAINRGLRTFKGIGRLEIETPQQRQSGRAAWAGSLPTSKFRLDFIGAGLPLASVAGDGQRVYLRHAGGVQSRPGSNPRLDDLLGLPVTAADLLQAMAGRLPDRADGRVSVHPGVSPDRWHLVFYDRFGTARTQAEIEAPGRLCRLAFFRPDGGLHYRIEYGSYRPEGAYWLPARLEVRDAQGVCRIEVERWWADPDLPESLFILEAASR